MATINLTANGTDQERILAYLQENASDVLAGKINNGTPFEKDGKQLVNKKTLGGFVSFACKEARKLAEKGAEGSFVDDPVVYGWAIHYFEEDSIVGKLYNQDGTEYKPPAPVKKSSPSTPPKPVAPPPKPKSQFSFFDMLNEKKDEQKAEVTVQDDEPKVEQVVEQKQQQPQPKPVMQEQSKPKNPLYEKYMTYVNRHPDSVIAIRVGDFYEIFGKRAVAIADELGLTLTGRDLGLEQRIPMIGFPYHAAETYFKKIRQKHSVVVVENDGECKLNEFAIDDILDGDDELTEEEMRQFDGDITEPKDLTNPTPTNETPKATCEPAVDSESPYDEIALAKVVKLLGNNLILR